ncbi:MAG: Holliday junction DNA helicase RuvA [Chloroflexi bacterium]|nr:MAG: Holliday junction DNA helicase RuvA [Chloroflexota bacterium]
MISQLRGIARSIDRERSNLVLEVNGIGYEVLLPVFVLRSLLDRGKKEGDEIELKIYYHVGGKPPRPMLVGFNNEVERRFFEKLIQVEDLGPLKAARAFVFSVSTVANAIENRDTGLLEKMPGVGPRLAQKIVATLHGKVAEFALLRDERYDSLPAPERADIRSEAIEVLVGLGYRRREAVARVEEALHRKPEIRDTEGLLREVFRLEREG